jgi:Sulfotransferase family
MASMHFISGLPRSGSTLLAALLRQNPRFEAGMSGPLAGLFGAPRARSQGRRANHRKAPILIKPGLAQQILLA